MDLVEKSKYIYGKYPSISQCMQLIKTSSCPGWTCIWPNGIIFHQPRFPWNKGISLTKPPFGGNRSCEVAINWPDVKKSYRPLNKQLNSRRFTKTWSSDPTFDPLLGKEVSSHFLLSHFGPWKRSLNFVFPAINLLILKHLKVSH